MRYSYLAVAFAAAMSGSVPAVAGDLYLGVEGGAIFPVRTEYDVQALRVQTVPTGSGLAGQTVTTTNVEYGSGFVSRYKTGIDADAIIGYDFGFFRLEGELGYKSSRARRLTVSSSLLAAINTAPIAGVTSNQFSFGDRVSVLSGMVNGLVDVDLGPGLRVYAGGGAGRARVRAFGQRDNAWAGQLIAGAAVPISDRVDLGVKYRYFQARRLAFTNGAQFTGPGGAISSSSFDQRGKFSSHSLLASLIFKFGNRPEPAPAMTTSEPPLQALLPAAPATTQTCPDGSVVDASAMCPMPPPPPPPPPTPERG